MTRREATKTPTISETCSSFRSRGLIGPSSPTVTGLCQASGVRHPMRIRLLGQYIHASLAVLTVTEASLFFVAVYAVAMARFHIGLQPLGGLPEIGGAL